MEFKLCRKCQTIKPVTGFERNRKVCKVCRNKRKNELYKQNPEHRRKQSLKYYHRDKDSRTPEQIKHRTDYNKIYCRRPDVMEKNRISGREHYWKNRDEICKNRREQHKLNPKNPKPREPYKEKCHALFGYAVKMGRVEKQPCIICGKFPAEGHHHDYWKPLDVIWLCRKHHAALHREAFCIYPRITT